jgi:hypothetical protein
MVEIEDAETQRGEAATKTLPLPHAKERSAFIRFRRDTGLKFGIRVSSRRAVAPSQRVELRASLGFRI